MAFICGSRLRSQDADICVLTLRQLAHPYQFSVRLLQAQQIAFGCHDTRCRRDAGPVERKSGTSQMYCAISTMTRGRAPLFGGFPGWISKRKVAAAECSASLAWIWPPRRTAVAEVATRHRAAGDRDDDRDRNSR